MKPRFLLLALLGLTASAGAQPLGPPPPPGGVLLDGVAAVVEREVITRSDVERTARLQLVLQGGAVAGLTLPVEDALRSAVLNLLIVEELVILDARRHQRFPETDEDVALQVARVRARFSSEEQFLAFLKVAQLPEQDFLDAMRREARVDRMVSSRLRDATVSTADLDRVLEEHPELGAPGSELARQRARPVALQQAGRDAARRYVEGLREHNSVRVVAHYAGSDP